MRNFIQYCCYISLFTSICVCSSSYLLANNINDYGNCRNPDASWYLWYTNIYPSELVDLAQDNLKKYCCTQKKSYLSSSQIIQCKNNTSDYYVDSPWMYDHLVDVGMRYLDGDIALQYKTKNGNIITDKKWKEWREFVSQYGSSPTWRIPLELQNKYTEFWGTMIEDFGILESDKDCELRLSQFEQYDKERENLTLAKKYFLLCEITSCMVDRKKNNRIDSCQSLVTQRILGERDYVQWLLILQGTRALSTNFEAYALWHVNQDKFSWLLEKIVMMSKWLGFVNNKVNEITKTCSA